MKADWDELKRLHAAIGQSTKDNYLWSAAIEASFPAILAERSAAQKALEFAEYLAKSAERYMEAVNKYHEAQEAEDDEGTPIPDAVSDAIGDHFKGLRCGVYEFRKRAAFDKETQSQATAAAKGE